MFLSCATRFCSLRHRASSPRADTTTVRAPPSRERVAVPDRAAGFAGRASISIRASRARPPPPRRARRCSSRAQPAAAPCITAPAHREPTRRPRERRRAASESSFPIAPPASPSVRRSQSAPRARGSRRRAERAGVPLVLSPLLFLASPRRLTESRHDDRASAAEPRASRRSRSRRRLRRACVDLNPRLARAAAAAASSAPMLLSCSARCCSFCVTAPAHREPTRRPRERRRAASESSFLVGPPLLRPSAADSAVGERVALHTTANFVDVTASYAAAAPPIAAPSLLSRHDDGERAPSREHFVVATERRWLLPACAGLVVGKRHQAPRSTSMSTARLCPRQASERFDESSGRARRSHRSRTRS